MVDNNSNAINIEICTSEQVDSETGLPDIEEPLENTIYFVAS